MKINGLKKITVPVFSQRKYQQWCKKQGSHYSTLWHKRCNGKPVIYGMRISQHIQDMQIIEGKVWAAEMACYPAHSYLSSTAWEVQKPLTPELEAEVARGALELLKDDCFKEVKVANPGGKLGVALGAIQDWLDEYLLVDIFNDTLLVYEVGDKYLSVNIEDPRVVVLTKLTDRSEANGKL